MFRNPTKSSGGINDELPGEEEKEQISKLRSAYQEEFAKREAEGRDHSCFFSELALARVLRGNDGDLEQAKKWYGTFLEKATLYNVDDMIADLSKKLDESGSDLYSTAILPHYEEVEPFFNITLSAPELTPKGDVVQYVPMVDFDKRGIVEEVNWNHWVEFNRSIFILRCLQCDRLSRKQGRMVRCYTIADVQDCSMDTMFYGPFDRDHEDDCNRFVREIAAEIMGPLYVVNPSWKISSLYSIVSRFAPAKFAKKIQFQRGDTFSDPEFLSLFGGREQLEKLYATRKGLTLARAAEEEGEVYTGEPDALATERELEMIGMLRDEFKEELEKRQTEGLLHPFFFGDVALTRVIRGNNSRYKAAVAWMRAFLKKIEDWKVDELVAELRNNLKDAESPVVPDVKYLPFRAELHPFFRSTLCAPRSTPAGDPVCYTALVDIDRDAILQKVNWEHWVRFARSMALLSLMAADQQSSIQGRIVRVINIWDLEGSSMTSLRHPEWNEKHSRDVSAFMETICIEMAGPQYVVNAPWLLVRLFNLFSTFLPEKFTRKFQIMSSDGTSYPDFYELIGGKEQLQELLASRIGLVALADIPEGEEDIAAGQSYEKFQDIMEGQQASWNFTVIAGYGDALFGTSDIEFRVGFYSLADVPDSAAKTVTDESTEKTDAEDAIEDGLEIVAPCKCTRMTGNFTATKSGYLLLRWSNEHSTVRGKSIKYKVEVAATTTTEVADSAGPNTTD